MISRPYDAFDLLSEPIRKYIRDKQWEMLRPIQAAAITRIIQTKCNYILASKTASGKTEASFLPILSKIDWNQRGVQVLYISPLIALINDQFERIEELCSYLEIPVTKWHGEANLTKKKKLLKNPSGVVLITPESLEAMFSNNPYNVKCLFSALKYVVIDEIHAFIGIDRGIHLKSLLARLQRVNHENFNWVGLSATIGDYQNIKKFVVNAFDTKVLLDNTSKESIVQFKYFANNTSTLSLELLKDIYLEVYNNKVLIFPNNRGLTEEIAVKLKKLAEKVGGHQNYFSHHSSINRQVREYVEFFAKNSNRDCFAISCTSTLELGIDIGSLNKIIQIDATFSIASLIQRLGRSGRNDGEMSHLVIYATNKWSLLQSLAIWTLYKEGFIEPPLITSKPYDILLHQILSITKGYSSLPYSKLIEECKSNYTFDEITRNDIINIIDELINKDYLEKLNNEIIIGVEGEKIVNNKNFYTAFKTENTYSVAWAGNTLGEISSSPQIQLDENIFLVAKIWKIVDIDYKRKRIEVRPANDGNKPIFDGVGGNIHQRIREKMLEVLLTDYSFDFLDQPSQNELIGMQKDFSMLELKDINQRPILLENNKLVLFTFTSTRINRTLLLLLKQCKLKCTLSESDSMIGIDCEMSFFSQVWSSLPDQLMSISTILNETDNIASIISYVSKWGWYLPPKYQIELIKQKYYDIQETEKFLRDIKLKYCEFDIPIIK